jgi:1-acyl-sn-glycerol-3-phosphate acyltransferase
MKLIFTLYFWLMFILVTLIGVLFTPFGLLIFCGLLGRKVDATCRWAICIYGWVLITVVPFLAPVKAESRTGKLPLPAIIVANHNSAIDAYLFGTMLTQICFVTNWAFKIPVYGIFMRLASYINADEGWEKVCLQGAKLLQSGVSIVIWPEGHRSRDGRLGRFKNGAFALAVKTGAPVIPVCILGSRKFLPPGKRLLTPSRVKMIYLDSIYPDPQNNQEQEIIRLRNAAREVIEKTLEAENQLTPTISDSKGLKEAKNVNSY